MPFQQLHFFRMRFNDEIFDRYYANRRMETDTGDCSGDCKTNTLCDLLATTSQMFLSCLLYTMGVNIDTTAHSEIYPFQSIFNTAPIASLPIYASILSLIVTLFH